MMPWNLTQEWIENGEQQWVWSNDVGVLCFVYRINNKNKLGILCLWGLVADTWWWGSVLVLSLSRVWWWLWIKIRNIQSEFFFFFFSHYIQSEFLRKLSPKWKRIIIFVPINLLHVEFVIENDMTAFKCKI